jgi:hypothetical protein
LQFLKKLNCVPVGHVRQPKDESSLIRAGRP